MTKKRIVWLCVLVVAAICAVAWLWPRSVEKMTDLPVAEVESWSFVDQTVTEKDRTFEEVEGRMEDLEELYTFRFSRRYFSTSLSFRRERVCYIMLCGDNAVDRDMTLLSDGRVWVDGWHYKLAGGKAELERLNQWLTDVMGEPAGQTE